MQHDGFVTSFLTARNAQILKASTKYKVSASISQHQELVSMINSSSDAAKTHEVNGETLNLCICVMVRVSAQRYADRKKLINTNLDLIHAFNN
jgi:hypothetical protein